MQAQGLLFLSKTRPSTQRAADGTFGLQLFVVDRISNHQVEPWVLHFNGPEAEAFWGAHQSQLTPGAALRTTAERLRSHSTARTPEIHARAIELELVSVPTPKATPVTATTA